MLHGLDRRKDTRPMDLGGKTRLGAILVLGIAGAAVGTVAALIFGYGVFGVVAGYVGGGLAATILTALAIHLCETAGSDR